MSRVQHIPAGHPYARSVSGDGVDLLPDPPVPGAPAGRWWPHGSLEAAWIRRSAPQIDVVHLHFGFEHRRPAQMREWAGALREARIPLVVTVHDLVNPHLGPDPAYDALLDAVLPAADAVLTLTGGAADEIHRRWARRAVVHPHPHVVDEDWLDRPRPEHDGWVVDVHAKSLRASFDVGAVVLAADAIRDLPGAVLRLHVHDDVLDPTHPRHDPRLVGLTRRPDVDVRVHAPLSDAELWADLLDADLALLPYCYATHSGWLEMCHDLGADVLTSDVGRLGEQRPVRTWAGAEDLPHALAAAHADHRGGLCPTRPPRHDRLAERDAVRALHDRVYREAIEACA